MSRASCRPEDRNQHALNTFKKTEEQNKVPYGVCRQHRARKCGREAGHLAPGARTVDDIRQPCGSTGDLCLTPHSRDLRDRKDNALFTSISTPRAKKSCMSVCQSQSLWQGHGCLTMTDMLQIQSRCWMTSQQSIASGSENYFMNCWIGQRNGT